MVGVSIPRDANAANAEEEVPPPPPPSGLAGVGGGVDCEGGSATTGQLMSPKITLALVGAIYSARQFFNVGSQSIANTKFFLSEPVFSPCPGMV